ncbi:hypothetical protein GCM10009674_13860 [Nesterenkonia xinjiangensis]
MGMTTQGRNAEMMSISPPRIMALLPAWNTPHPVERPARMRAVRPPKIPRSELPLLPVAVPFAVVVML